MCSSYASGHYDTGFKKQYCESGMKEIFHLTTHSTHFIYGYMVKDHSDSKRGNPLSPHGLLFPNSSKSSFICIISQTG